MATLNAKSPEAQSPEASMGTLVAGIAHEINNPITYVLTNLSELGTLCEALREGILTYRAHVGSDAAQQVEGAEGKIEQAGGLDVIDELISDAMQGAVRIRDLVRDLLAVAHPSEPCEAEVDVSELLDSTLGLVRRQLELRATLERDFRAERLVPGDAAKLGQVFLNLITNAMHACTPGSGERPHRIVVRTHEVGNAIEIEVEDSGQGISSEAASQVFLPFFTTKDVGKGTGLGLFITREIVQQHGGTIGFSAAPERGTIFRVTLPFERRHGDT